MADPAPYEDRLYTALRSAGVIAGPKQVDAITEAIREIMAEELASLGGHLLGHYSDTDAVTADGTPVLSDHELHPLAQLGGFCLTHFGRDG
jgi:hypothetical protein